MSWIVLVVSGLFEAVWATALSKSEGLTKLVPSLIFGVSVLISMGGLSYALRDIPVGTGYAVWVAIGAVTTVVWGMVTGAEPVSVLRVIFIVGIIACVIGLKMTTHSA
ncbi:QacE family quaternary ammonium compound efflux SMR transporter [Arcanobacterium haemolyticum]|nr:QacE family quaternary ammonium compound efflux SMR transporter [Arcanobacterium haemolyticum]